MAKLDAKERNDLPKGEFAEPGERKFPVPDASHAKVAKSRASQAVNEGRMSKSEEAKIDSKADKVLDEGKPKRKKESLDDFMDRRNNETKRR